MEQEYEIGDEVHFDNMDGRSGIGVVQSKEYRVNTTLYQYRLRVFEFKDGPYEDGIFRVAERPFTWYVFPKKIVHRYKPYDPEQIGDTDDDL